MDGRAPQGARIEGFAALAEDLREIALREGCKVHGYVLMSNHVHLLMTPTASGQVSRVMQSSGRSYVRYINDRYRRTGTLWDGRYKSSLVGREPGCCTAIARWS